MFGKLSYDEILREVRWVEVEFSKIVSKMPQIDVGLLDPIRNVIIERAAECGEKIEFIYVWIGKNIQDIGKDKADEILGPIKKMDYVLRLMYKYKKKLINKKITYGKIYAFAMAKHKKRGDRDVLYGRARP